MADPRPRLLAVLIDADNVSAGDAAAIMNEIAGLGEAGLRRVYGDWSSGSLSGWHDRARDLGLVMYQQSANTKGKNASDIGLVIDAMDILHSGRFDGFVIVSSDSDFTRLASRIREEGLQVIGIGRAKTPKSLIAACNRFILIENIVTDAASAVPSEPNAVKTAEAPPSPPAPAATKFPPSKAVPLVLRAMKEIGEETDWFSLGQLGQFIQRNSPDFDPRSYGSAKLSDLLRKTGKFEVKPDEGNHLIVRKKG
ncbi:MAG: NYN domain-containing protein [Tabrizicola sp.]|nr:NYN domain-containing protein [Tabrizicola sp.]